MNFKDAAKPVIKQYSDKKFRGFFGCSITTCTRIFGFIDGTGVTRANLLWTLYFMKVYNTEIVGCSAWNVDSRKYMDKIKYVINILLFCLPDFEFQAFAANSSIPNVVGIVDVTRVKIYRPTNNQNMFYSPHDVCHVLKFEVVCSITNDTRIMWVNGGFGGRMADITISRDMGFLDELGPQQKLIADLGYRGADPQLWTAFPNPTTPEELVLNRQLNGLRTRIERINQRIKIYGCFVQIWQS